MTGIEQLTSLGYETGVAVEPDEGAPIYNVQGYGLVVYVAGDDDETLNGLIDSHAERAFLLEHPELTAALIRLGRRGIATDLDLANKKILVTKPGDAAATAMTPVELRDYIKGLPPYDPFKDVRAAVAGAATLPQVKAALGQLLDRLGASE